MPATVTHAYFAMDVYDALPIGLKSLLMDEKKRMRMFGQSMDALFFYNKISLKKGEKVQEFGNYFHTHKSQEFFLNLINYIKYNCYYKIPDVMSFLYGMICHYKLDSKIHPFVFYKTGVFKKEDKETYRFQQQHEYMEIFIDNYFIKQREHSNPYAFSFYDFCFDFMPFSLELEEVINYAFEETFGVKNMCYFYQKSLKQMYSALKYFRYDKYGVKKKAYQFFDLLKPKTTFQLKAISYHRSLIDQKNYLNLKHEQWNHPCLKREKHKESVVDLYLEALYETNQLIKEVNAYLKDTKKVNLKKLFPNLSYTTGKDCKKGENFKYFEEEA